MTRGRLVGPVIALLTLLVTAGCGSGTGASAEGSSPTDYSPTRSAPTGSLPPESPPTGYTPTSSEQQLTGTLTVFAAASLQVAFNELRTQFRAAHPEVDFPEITYDGSSTLVTQLLGGASADVFASADEQTMDRIGGLLAHRADFATNTLRIAVAPGNPLHIGSLADLAKPGVLTVVCAPQVPCGTAAHRALDAAGVDLKPASEEQNVTAVLTKVEAGEADAGLVYATDIHTSGGKVEGIDFPQAAHAVNTYPIAVLAGAPNPAAARAFVDLVTGPAGQKVLAGVGFGPP